MGVVSVSLPSDGTAADVADYNTPITTIVNAINGNLDSNNLASNAVTTAKITDDSVTFAKVAAGMVIQMASFQTGTMATGTTLIPFDNTIPQITEGTEFMTLAYTPKSTTNILVIEVTAFLYHSATSGNMAGAIFQDATANALAAGAFSEAYAGTAGGAMFVLKHKMAAGTTSSTTFRFRAGGQNAGTTTFNGIGGASFFGGAQASTIVITEYKA